MRRSRHDLTTSPLSLAPFWKRVLAPAIDVMTVLAAIVLAAPAAGLIFWLAGHNESLNECLERRMPRPRAPNKWTSTVASRRSASAFGVNLVVAIYRRNHQSRGQELMRIRRVNAADGGRVTVRSAIVRYLFSALTANLSGRALRRSIERQRERFEERNVIPCGPPLIAMGLQLVVHLGCVLASPKRQGLADLVAGIVTVRADEPTTN